MILPVFSNVEQPISLAFARSGAVAVLDRDGRRLWITDAAGNADDIELVDPARCVRFFEDEPIVLTSEQELVRVKADGSRGASLRVRDDARSFAITPSGSAIVVYGRDGTASHHTVLERLGASPLAWTDAPLVEATAVACDPGGVWVAGTGRDEPTYRVIYMRPVSGGYTPVFSLPLPAPARSVALGPDGAFYVVLEPGDSIVRIERGRVINPVPLETPVHEVARRPVAAGEPAGLSACGPRGMIELDELVDAPATAPDFTPPACDSAGDNGCA